MNPQRLLPLGLALGTLASVLPGCSIGGLSASSSCKDFMASDEASRQQVIDELYSAAHDPATRSAMGEANIVLNSEYICSQAPDRKLSELPM